MCAIKELFKLCPLYNVHCIRSKSICTTCIKVYSYIYLYNRVTDSVHQRKIGKDPGVQHSRGKGWDSWGRHLPTKGKPGFTSTREGKLKKMKMRKKCILKFIAQSSFLKNIFIECHPQLTFLVSCM